jgi:hypothetical protein
MRLVSWAACVVAVVPPIYLHMVGAEATLERAADVGWVRVCNSPCDGYAPASGTYRVAVPVCDRTHWRSGVVVSRP